MMVYGMVALFLQQPPGDNWLEVEDVPAGGVNLEDFEWNPAFTEDQVAGLKLVAAEVGSRTFHSMRVPATAH